MTENKIIKDAAVLHQDMYAYAKLKTMEKVLTVAGILMVLNHGFSVEQMGQSDRTDGELLYHEILKVIDQVEMDEGKEIIKKQFEFLKDTKILNDIYPALQKTPLQHFTEFLREKIFIPFQGKNSAEDYIGRFYTEFMSYENSEKQNLGIILTPAHVTSLFADLLNITPKDVVLDPCAGTAGFLISGLQKELENSTGNQEEIRNEHFYGFEVQHFMFAISCINLIVRGCNKINIQNRDFLAQDPKDVRNRIHANVGMINPPYALGSLEAPEMYEMGFIKHLLDCVEPGGRVAAIIPTSSMTAKAKKVQEYKKEILKDHTLEGVISMNPNTFCGVNTQTVIVVFTTGVPHSKKKISKFINFQNDGFELTPHMGLLKTDTAESKRQHLLDVWTDKNQTSSDFCIYRHVTAKDEWLYSSFHCREDIPDYKAFEDIAEDYLAFRSSNFFQGKKYLFKGQNSFSELSEQQLPDLKEKQWKIFTMEDVFRISATRVTKPNELIPNGIIPRVCCASTNNGIEDTYQNPATESGNVLTVDSAVVGTVYYQQVPFSSSSHVEKLVLKNRELNLFIGLFLASVISFAIEGKYNYGYKFSKARIRKQTILLPIDEKSNIDYDYMESYMMSLLKRKWKQFNKMF